MTFHVFITDRFATRQHGMGLPELYSRRSANGFALQ
jgi:hypothetical protein